MIVRILKHYLKLILFKRKWKRTNRHNFTEAKNFFPIELVEVGNYSYGVLEVYSWGSKNEKLKIGSFVSIALGVKFLLGGNHRFDTPFTFPLQSYFSNEGDDAISKGPIVIEDDVWIGMGSIFLSGIKVGRGAVVAAATVVTKDVPPYAIVAGNPMKIIKYRFNEKMISELLKIDFNKLSNEFIRENIQLLNTKIDGSTINKLESLFKKE